MINFNITERASGSSCIRL